MAHHVLPICRVTREQVRSRDAEPGSFRFRYEGLLDGVGNSVKWMHFQALNSLHNRVGTDVVFDLVSASGRPGAVILRLGYLGHSSWRPDGIDTRWGLNLTEKVLVSYMLEA